MGEPGGDAAQLRADRAARDAAVPGPGGEHTRGQGEGRGGSTCARGAAGQCGGGDDAEISSRAPGGTLISSSSS